MPFFGTITERDFREKNPQHRNIYKLIQCCALDFFPQNTLGDGPAFWIFFQDSRIRVKDCQGTVVMLLNLWPRIYVCQPQNLRRGRSCVQRLNFSLNKVLCILKQVRPIMKYLKISYNIKHHLSLKSTVKFPKIFTNFIFPIFFRAHKSQVKE